MIYPTPRPINRFDVIMACIFGGLILLIGICGALLVLLQIATFVLTPDPASALLAAAALVAVVGFLAIGTAGWIITRHYLNPSLIQSGDRALRSYRAAFLDFSGVFGTLAGLTAFFACLAGILAGGADANLLVLTAMSALTSAAAITTWMR